ncbi:MAG: hypothetical protein ACRYFS_05070 [Janthinobacterium lividum]
MVLAHKNLSGCLPCWERLERVGWKTSLAFESYGTGFGIRTNDPALGIRIAGLLPPNAVLSSSPLAVLYSLSIAHNCHRLYRGIEQIARAHHLEDVLTALESDLHGQIAERAQGSLFVHAGVVGWQGAAIVIPGRSFSGKTSLTAALIRAGAEYLSDEYAIFDTLGRVHPYPKLLSFRDAAGQPLEKCSAESLGGQTGTKPLPIGLILDTKYESGACWQPHPMTPGASLLTLLGSTVQVRHQPQWALEILQQAVSGAVGVKSKRGEADEAAAWVLGSQQAVKGVT